MKTPTALRFPSHSRDDETRRTSRVLEIIQMIAIAPRRWSRKRLSEHYEVSERMIQKDLKLIKYKLGLRLSHSREGYEFERTPHLPTTAYSFAEALALLTAARSAQTLPGVNSAELAAAIARLESIFPLEILPLLREATEQLPRRAVKVHRQTMLALLHRALAERRRVQILYATASRQGDVHPRVVEPYSLLPYGRSWYLIAFDHHRQTILQFKIDRVQEAEILDTVYTLPKDFDADAYLGDTWGMMRGADFKPEEVHLLFDATAGQWVSEENWHRSQEIEFLPDGQVRVRFFVGVTPEMVNWLLYYGERVLVEKPDWLRKEVREKHQRAVDNFQDI
ncbi:MAG: WYL domain-containing transcriptional regulator [Chloroflexota bacterium]